MVNTDCDVVNSPVQGVCLLQSAAVPGDQVPEVEEQGERVRGNPGDELPARLGTRQQSLCCPVSCLRLVVPARCLCFGLGCLLYIVQHMDGKLTAAAPGQGVECPSNVDVSPNIIWLHLGYEFNPELCMGITSKPWRPP